jgi:hypothetical protein
MKRSAIGRVRKYLTTTWDLLAARVDLRLVTGDKLLLESGGPGVHRVITPQAFVLAWRAGAQARHTPEPRASARKEQTRSD